MEYNFEQPRYSVYARVDKKGRVIKIFSTCFEEPKDEDIFIKTGHGDEYVHTGYYHLFTKEGFPKYKIENYNLVERSELELEEDKRPVEIKKRMKEIVKLLNESDYKLMKKLDGAMTDVEYAPTKVQREIWREEYGNLEIELARIEE